MTNKHFQINEEFDITLNLKVNIDRCSNYTDLNEIQLADSVANFKSEVIEFLENKLINNNFSREEITNCVDDWSFEVTKQI